MTVTEKSYVKVHYKGTLNDGTVFDSSEGREPLEVVLGNRMLIPGFEAGLVGLNAGDKKEINIPCAEAYGEAKPEAVQEVPKDKMPQDHPLEAGLQLVAQTPHGPVPVKIKEVKDDVVVLDLNHPLAGQDLTFTVEVVEEREGTPEDLQKIMGAAAQQGAEGEEAHEHGDSCGCGHGDKKEGDCCQDEKSEDKPEESSEDKKE